MATIVWAHSFQGGRRRVGPGRLHGSILLLGLLLAGCAHVDPLPTEPPSIEPPPVVPAADAWRNRPVVGLPFNDPRLASVFSELRQHPEWLDEPLGAEPTVLALVPMESEVCLALEGSGGDVFVTIDPAGPWRVRAVAIDRGEHFEGGRQHTFDPDDLGENCPFVAFGRRDAWPASLDAIEVTGNADAPLARAIAEAVYAKAERFGIDRQGVPDVLVNDRIEPAPAGWTCLQAVVFVGGRRSEIVIGTRPTGDGSRQVETRIVKRALWPPEPRREGHC